MNDPTFWAYTSAVVMLLGNLAQFFLRLQDGSKRASGQPTEDYCDRVIRGKIYEHEVHCSNLEDIVKRINDIEKRVREDLTLYRASLAESLKTLRDHLIVIEAKLDHHIDKG